MNNIKKFGFLLCFVVLSSFKLAFGMATKQNLIRVVPVSYNQVSDPDKNGWNILLGHDTNPAGPYWNDFSLPQGHGASFGGLFGKPSDLEVAKNALSSKTNNIYNDSTVDWQRAVQVFDSPSGNTFYFVPVKMFKTNRDLNISGQNQQKDNFSWVQAASLLMPKRSPGQDVQLIWYGKAGKTQSYNISRGFLDQINRVWDNSLLSKLNSLLPGQNQVQSQMPQSGITWLNIPAGSLKFYEKNKPYYEFTNFYEPKKPINIDKREWKTSEHYFQAMKFTDLNTQETIRNQSSPRDAFSLARDLINKNKSLLVANWHKSVKYQAMLDALKAKFSQDSSLKNLLLGTNNLILVEDTGLNPNKNQIDTEWGAGLDGLGQNHLGRLLMLVREELKSGKKLTYDPDKTLSLDALKKVNFDLNKVNF